MLKSLLWGTLLVLMHTYAQAQHVLDSVIIKNFAPWEYKAAATNYSGTMDKDGILYFANETGVLRFDGSEWELIKLPSFGPAYSVFISSTGRLYVGGLNEFGYLERTDSTGYRFQSVRDQIQDRDFEAIWQIKEVDGDIYFSSYEGLVRYDEEAAHLTDMKYSGVLMMNDELYVSQFDGYLYTLEKDSSRLLNDQYKWKNDNIYGALPLQDSTRFLFYTSENGMFTYDLSTNLMEKFATSDDEFIKKRGLFDYKVWQDSIFVFTTWYEGLFFMDQNGTILKRIGKDDQLSTNSTQGMLIDKRGNLWVCGYNGISYLQFPYLMTEPKPEIKTMITRIEHEYNDQGLIKSATFHFATPGYVKSDLEYAYYLLGFDEGFGEWTDNVKKEYTNLSSGQYTFKVKARLPDGTETEVASHVFQIKSPWYFSSWFILLCIASMIALVTLAFRIRTQHLKRLNRRLEMIIESRTHELIEQREQLKETNEELMMTNAELDNFVYRSSHDLVAPLKSLRGLIHIARKDTGDPHQHEYLTLMNNSVEKLEDFIKSIMDYSVNNKHEIARKAFVFNDLIDEIVSEIRYFDNAEKVSLTRNYDPELVLKTDDRRLKIVLSNLLTNCVKYHNYDQPDPNIELSVSTQPDSRQVEIVVSDNGIGIDREHLDKIFNMFFRASDTTPTQGSGLGLYIVKDTITKIGGDITVDSDIGVGTTFCIVLYEATADVMSLSSSA